MTPRKRVATSPLDKDENSSKKINMATDDLLRELIKSQKDFAENVSEKLTAQTKGSY
jgi:hypothetical protein